MNIQIAQKKKVRKHLVLNLNEGNQKQNLYELNSGIKNILLQIVNKCKSLCFTPKIETEEKNAQQINETNAQDAPEERKLFNILDNLTSEERMNKAIRHFHDALLFRTSRHDIDGKSNRNLQLIWRWTNSSFWSTWLWLIAIIYQFITFFEPVNRNDSSLDEDSQKKLTITESLLLFYLLCDFLLCCKVRVKKPLLELLKTQKKLAFKGFFVTLLLTDFIYFLISYPNNTLRFGRILRPLILISYSKDLRRTIKGIFGSGINIVILLIFQSIVMALWAFIGINTVGMIEGEINKDDNIIVYSDFFKLYNLLYMLSILDYYPDIMMPPVQISYLYMIYFIPYIILFIFLLMPIPLAIVYEGYRQNRMLILIGDRLKQRESLLACFLCLDDKNYGFVSQKTFYEFAVMVYGRQLSKQEISELYILLDNNESGKISIEEFFNILQVIDENRKYTIKTFKPLRSWIAFREYCEKKLKIMNILESHYFAIIMFMVTIVNCSMIIFTIIITPDDQLNTIFVNFDYVFFAIYTIEILLKLVGYGVEQYFDDSWNNFDFFLVMFQLCFEYIFYRVISQNFVQSFKANRMLRLAKLQKVFRLFRAFRTVKVIIIFVIPQILSVFMVGVEVFNTVKDLFVKILICIPVVCKQIVVVWIVFYIYGILSIEIFSDIGNPYHTSPYNSFDCSVSKKKYKKFSTNEDAAQIDWSSCNYADFNTFWGALLMLFQVFTGDLSTQVFNLSYKLQTMALPAIFLGSFTFITFFLLALLSGLIWEVFSIVEDIWKEEREYDQKVTAQEKLEEPEVRFSLSCETINEEQNIKKKKKSINLNPNKTNSEDQQVKKNQPKEIYNIFTLDILADDDEENLYLSDSDMFDQFDKLPYLSENIEMRDKPLEQQFNEEEEEISENEEGKVQQGAVLEANLNSRYQFERMMSVIEEVNDSNQIIYEEGKTLGIHESNGIANVQIMSKYLLQENPEKIQSRLLTTPVSSTQEDQIKNQNVKFNRLSQLDLT